MPGPSAQAGRYLCNKQEWKTGLYSDGDSKAEAPHPTPVLRILLNCDHSQSRKWEFSCFFFSIIIILKKKRKQKSVNIFIIFCENSGADL